MKKLNPVIIALILITLASLTSVVLQAIILGGPNK